MTNGSGRPDRELSALAIGVHTALGVLHLLGVAYNIRRVVQGHKKNMFDVAVHSTIAAYDFYAVTKHVRDFRDG
jgi:hypothetical protein